MTTIDPRLVEKADRYRQVEKDVQYARQQLSAIKRNIGIKWLKDDLRDIYEIEVDPIDGKDLYKPSRDGIYVERIACNTPDLQAVRDHIVTILKGEDEMRNLRGQIVNAGYGSLL